MKLHSLHVVLTALAALVVVDARPPPSGQTKTDSSAPRGPRINPGTPKYFSEPGEGEIYGHYDIRYWPGSPVAESNRHRTQHNMIRAYLSTMRALGYETWLAHGTLLGWWWNGQSLPWDGDLDVQVWGSALGHMATNHNMTTHDYTHYEMREGAFGDTVEQVTSSYLLDINPNYVERTRGNWMNVIDARWIDTTTGLFIDITGLSENRMGLYSCKNYHAYKLDDLYPMQETTFEGVRALVPNAYEKILREEYNQKALEITEYEGHHWDDQKQLWLKD